MSAPWQEKLQDLGLTYPVMSGIQIDLNAVYQVPPEGADARREVSFCDHDCTSEFGGYDCPAARSRNPHARPKTAPPPEVIEKWIKLGAEGLRGHRDQFLETGLARHCERFHIPREVWEALRAALRTDSIEVNLFGGNPELYLPICELISRLTESGFRVNLTTTGRRLMRDEVFINAFCRAPPNILALSADDLSVQELDRLLQLSQDGLRKAWKETPAEHGQRRKAIEAVYAADMASRIAGFPPILFNMVISRVNIGHAQALMQALEARFPKALVNPYPCQQALHGGQGFFSPDELKLFEELIDCFIARTLSGERLVKRLQYWLMLKAAFETWRDDPEQVARSIAGHGIWHCARHESGRYLQIGRGKGPSPPEEKYPGGHLGCFWNQAVTEEPQLDSPEQVVSYLNKPKSGSYVCPGCAMPRLCFDLVNIQAGMDLRILAAFLKLRKQHAGF